MMFSFFFIYPIAVLLCAQSINAQVMAINHNRPIVVTRIDPIVNPGSISAHMHTVVGGSRFKSIYDAADLKKSKCTTADVHKDFSNYWSPTLYFKWNNGSIGIVNHAKQGFRVYYNNRFNDKDTNPNQVFAFPEGFTMLGGNPKIRTELGDDTASNAQDFACLGRPNPQTPDLPSHAGKEYCTTIRAQIHMPNCWDGIRASSADNSHVSYPLGGNSENGRCPPNFKRIPSLFYENFYDVDNSVMNSKTGQYVFSNGDTIGFAMHGDFSNGWDQDLIEKIVKDCYGKANDGNNCAIIKQSQTEPVDKCDFEGEYVDEETGRYNFVKELPGCIKIGGGASAGCAVPNIMDASTNSIVVPGAVGKPDASAVVSPAISAVTSSTTQVSSMAPMPASSMASDTTVASKTPASVSPKVDDNVVKIPAPDGTASSKCKTRSKRQISLKRRQISSFD